VSAKANVASPNSQRVDIARASRPDRAIAMTSVTRYAVCTQLSSLSGVCSDVAMRGSAAATIWISKIAMKSPALMVVKPTHSRR
jgi:hypothetical protein